MSPEHDPNAPIDSEQWLALSEYERIDLVYEYHSEMGMIAPSLESHASIHVMVENQIAEDVPEVRKTLARLMNQGLDRHDSIHAIGFVLAGNMFDMLGQVENPNTDAFMREYTSELKQLTAQSWLEEAGDDESEGSYHGEFPEFPDSRAHEKQIANLHAALGEKDFATKEELEREFGALLESGEIPDRVPRTPLEEAQDLMYQAWGQTNLPERIRLAREALDVSPDCADAYVLLAEEPPCSTSEMEDLFRKGVEAGERALGPDLFKEGVGHFWGILETRPYMRARHGLATILGIKGEMEEAIHHLKELLRLNPNDNQGVRGMLAGYLLHEGRDEELSSLLEQYEGDADPEILYTRALWMFRIHGECENSNKALEEAIKINSFVPSYLLGKRKIPKEISEYVELGGPEQAAAYAEEAVREWRSTQGALFWLRRQTSKKRRR